MPLTRTEARKILLSLDGASEGSHYGKPAIFIGEEFVTRIHHKEDAVVILTGSIEMRDVMLEAEPKLFYITDHYRNFPFVLARLSALTPTLLKQLIAGRAAQLAEGADKVKKRKKPLRKVGAKKKIAPKKAER